ncbi:MAG: oxygen-dependent coproporphyrinogen oxidase [Ignavibacteriae bacterium]|nr:oxygen-dependent coproporphyrinogen oxidase [Ignavibacteriota bacterium]
MLIVSSKVTIRSQAEKFFQTLQDGICSEVQAVDNKRIFQPDIWSHPEGGGGKTRILQHGQIFEKAGVNFSAVTSELTETLASRLDVQPQRIYATGISLVLHPTSPMIPTVHMNLRYLEFEHGDAWFGGGIDLTPYYLFEEDANHFHRTLKSACDKHDPTFYPRFKQWCDEYFFIKHRGEARGIGGIFFDYLREDLEKVFVFVQDIGKVFLDAYLPIVDRRRNEPWGEQEKEWQLIRRGRYAEFNLLYDRGTLFGLETRGRTESILMSLPPEVKWLYNHTPAPGSREARLLDVLKQPREWA